MYREQNLYHKYYTHTLRVSNMYHYFNDSMSLSIMFSETYSVCINFISIKLKMINLLIIIM